MINEGDGHMKSMNHLVEVQPRTLKMMATREEGIRDKKSLNFYSENEQSPLIISSLEQAITRLGEEVEEFTKMVKGYIQQGMNNLLRAIHPALLKLLLNMNQCVLMNDGNPKFRIIQQHLNLLIKLITKQLG